MNNMVGPNSMMRQIINMLKVNLIPVTCINSATVNCSAETQVDRKVFAQVQWGSASILNTNGLMIETITQLNSVDNDLFVPDMYAT